MAIVKRSFRLTTSDSARVEAVRDRWPRANASEVLRAAIAWFGHKGQFTAQSFADVSDALAVELAKDDVKISGMTLPDDEAEALDMLVAKRPPGTYRRFSRTELVRIALFVFSRVDDEELQAARDGIRRLVPGPKKEDAIDINR